MCLTEDRGPSDGERAILIGPVVVVDSLVVAHTLSVCPHWAGLCFPVSGSEVKVCPVIIDRDSIRLQLIRFHWFVNTWTPKTKQVNPHENVLIKWISHIYQGYQKKFSFQFSFQCL